jgi:hypothetical protein
MSELAILTAIVGALWAVAIGLVAVVWAMLREQNRQQGVAIEALVKQNTDQETQIGRLLERMKAREDAHAEHRENIGERLNRLEMKIDQLLRGGGSGRGGMSPYPGAYSTTERKDR